MMSLTENAATDTSSVSLAPSESEREQHKAPSNLMQRLITALVLLPIVLSITWWGGVHHLLMSALHQQLNQRLPEGYVALVEEREIYEKPHFTRLSLSAVGTTPAWFPSRSGGNLREGG